MTLFVMFLAHCSETRDFNDEREVDPTAVFKIEIDCNDFWKCCLCSLVQETEKVKLKTVEDERSRKLLLSINIDDRLIRTCCA